MDNRAPRGWLAVDDSTPSRRQRGRVTGALFVIGGTLVWLSAVVLPGWSGVAETPLTVLLVAVALIGMAQILLAERISATLTFGVYFFGTGAIAAAQDYADAGGAAGIAIGMLYVWVIVVFAMFFSPVATAIMATFVVVAQFTVLVVASVAAWLPQLVLTTGTCVAGAAVSGILAHRLRQLTLTDALTGVANRRGMQQALLREIAIAAQRSLPLAVAVLDLDNFKQLNDTRGHAAGDRALVAATHAWQECLRPGDTLARLGGDEFLVTLPGCGSVAGFAIAARMASVTPPELSCSVGVAVFNGSEAEAELVARADAALYEA
ncbi:MAG: GGDEF domain-containing protein, partial [Nakamurella sp.]